MAVFTFFRQFSSRAFLPSYILKFFDTVLMSLFGTLFKQFLGHFWDTLFETPGTIFGALFWDNF